MGRVGLEAFELNRDGEAARCLVYLAGAGDPATVHRTHGEGGCRLRRGHCRRPAAPTAGDRDEQSQDNSAYPGHARSLRPPYCSSLATPATIRRTASISSGLTVWPIWG